MSLYSCAFKCFHGNFSVGTIFPLVWRKLLRLRCAYVSLRVLIFLLSVSTLLYSNTNATSCFIICHIANHRWNLINSLFSPLMKAGEQRAFFSFFMLLDCVSAKARIKSYRAKCHVSLLLTGTMAISMEILTQNININNQHAIKMF